MGEQTGRERKRQMDTQKKIGTDKSAYSWKEKKQNNPLKKLLKT